MKKLNIIFLLLIHSSFAKGACPDPTNVPPTSLTTTLTSCPVNKKLAIESKDEFRIKTYERLAGVLARQIKQNSEELALVANFYNSQNQEISSKKSPLYSQCKLDNFKTIEQCGGNKGPHYKEKLDFLLKNLPSTENTNFKKSSDLYSKVAGKFYSDLGMKSLHNKGQCPIDKTNVFTLTAQLDNVSADYVVNMINNDGYNLNVEESLFNQYVQLKIIKNSDDKEFISRFKSYLKNKPKNISPSEYINSFLTKENNQDTIAQALTEQCKTMNQNLHTYLCTDLEHLGSVDSKASEKLFDGLGTIDPLEKQTTLDYKSKDSIVLLAFGMQCIEKERLEGLNGKEKGKNSPLKKEQSTDQWYKDFTKNTRNENTNKSLINSFCSYYNCSTEMVKNVNSCKSGGPISSSDLRTIFECESQGKDCTSDILKSIKLLESLELMKSQTIGTNPNNSLNQTSTQNNTGKLSTFAENFFGAEGTLIALGKNPTRELIAERTTSINEKVNSITASSQLAATLPSPSISSQKVAEIPTTIRDTSSDSPSEIQPNYAPTVPINQPNQATKAQTISAIKTNSQSVKVQNQSGSSEESSRLRKEMEGMLDDLRKSSSESSEVSVAVSPTEDSRRDRDDSSSKAITSPRALSAEERRLRKWDDDLKNKERNLDQYARELANREYSSPSEADRAFQPNSGRGNVGPGSNLGRDMASSGGTSSGNGSGSSGLKLAASGAGATKEEQKANTAAIIQSDKESSSISVDELTKLSPDSLKTFGIDATRPFTLRVNFKDKTYEVPVKSFVHNGANVLGPVIDPKNKDLKEFLFKSPLFKSYLQYRMERESI